MIYTVTFNPAVDYIFRSEKVELGTVNRAASEEIYFGGKGINVSAVLKELGVESTALGFTAGFTGEAIEKGVAAMGINTRFIRLKHGNSRINVKVKALEETELNGQGPDIDGESIDKLFEVLEGLQSGDTLILAGSIPSTLPDNIYERILASLNGRGVRIAVDASGKLLLNVLKYHPFLIKPNNIELGELFGVKIDTPDKAAEYAAELQKSGALNVLVSMAEKGAVLLEEDGTMHKCGVCKGIVRNSVGAGDSMLAGFIAGYESGGAEYALRLGTACGGATAFSNGLAKKDEISRLLKEI